MKIVTLIASLQVTSTKIHGKYLSWLKIALSMGTGYLSVNCSRQICNASVRNGQLILSKDSSLQAKNIKNIFHECIIVSWIFQIAERFFNAKSLKV